MRELFFAMMKEEWRLHATMFGSLSFALFPVLIGTITFMGSLARPFLCEVIPGPALSFVVHAQFLLLGVMVGGFGLLGQEVMNRRFGQASLIAYSSRTLPLSDRRIFTVFVVKDTVYYFILWILPFISGTALAAPWSGIPFSIIGTITLTLTLSFLTGLALVFLLSTIYTRSLLLVAGVIAAGVLLAVLLLVAGPADPVYLFPPYALSRAFSPGLLLYSLVVVAVPFALAILFMTTEYPGSEKHFPDRFTPLVSRLTGFRSGPMVAKDLLDLRRSGGLVGQSLFSFALPLALIWVTLVVLARVLPSTPVLVNFAGVAGIIGATTYTWVTEFDAIAGYTFLPLGTGDLIRSKLVTFLFLQPLTVTAVLAGAVASGDYGSLLPATVLALSVSLYAVSVMVWLTGLWPSVMVYDARVLAASVVLVGPVLLGLIGAASVNTLYAFGSLGLLFPAYLFVRASYTRWEGWEKAFT
ncbi:MAG TPA: hypothetical protein PLN56_09500 [Methanoregulaceae archaeon]|nr:MAG: hypothetical protein IPI71_09290 [Methanolinea sp.]HON82385.1 hypothetical protein [Methanoregulaceae archaeon]HPD11212.1 hypothetical protein [Methanoregulaceae archaeon]